MTWLGIHDHESLNGTLKFRMAEKVMGQSFFIVDKHLLTSESGFISWRIFEWILLKFLHSGLLSKPEWLCVKFVGVILGWRFSDELPGVYKVFWLGLPGVYGSLDGAAWGQWGSLDGLPGVYGSLVGAPWMGSLGSSFENCCRSVIQSPLIVLSSWESAREASHISDKTSLCRDSAWTTNRRF